MQAPSLLGSQDTGLKLWPVPGASLNSGDYASPGNAAGLPAAYPANIPGAGNVTAEMAHPGGDMRHSELTVRDAAGKPVASYSVEWGRNGGYWQGQVENAAGQTVGQTSPISVFPGTNGAPPRASVTVELNPAETQDLKTRAGNESKPEAKPKVETKPGAEPAEQAAPKVEDKDKCEKTEGSSSAQGASKVEPTPAQIAQLVAEHSKDDGPPLTAAAARAILIGAQPEGTKSIVVAGDNTRGPDAYFLDGCGKLLGTVQIKAIGNWDSGAKEFKRELGTPMPSANDKLNVPFATKSGNDFVKFGSDVIAFQLPERTDVSRAMGRYWGQPERKTRAQAENWTVENNPHSGRQVLFVDEKGTILSGPSPVFNPPR